MLTRDDFDFNIGAVDSVSTDLNLHPLFTIVLFPIALIVLLVIGIVIIPHGSIKSVAAGVCLKRGRHRFLAESEKDYGTMDTCACIAALPAVVGVLNLGPRTILGRSLDGRHRIEEVVHERT